MSITLRKQYSAKYQVLELTTEVEDYHQLEVESANFDAIAKSELTKMVSLVEVFDDKRESGVVPTPAPKTSLASEKQKGLLAKNKDRAKMIASGLGIEWKEDLSFTSKEASSIINALFSSK